MVAATGIGSGLDIEGLVTQLVAAEGAPQENRIVRRETRLTSEISALGTLQGALASVQGSLADLSSISTFNQRSASVSGGDGVSASASTDAADGSFRVQVSELAQSQSLASASFSSLTDTVGEGTLTLRFGTVDVTPADPGPETVNSFSGNPDRDSVSIEITAGNNTLEGVRDAINASDADVSAVIVNDGSGFRLLLSSEQTGAANSIDIQVADTGDGNNTDAAGLSRLAFNTEAANLTQTVAGQDAQLTINGLAVTSSSNTVSDAIDGVTLNLTGTTEGNGATVTISENQNAARAAIDGLVSSFNNFITIANQLTDFDPETGAAGALQGDFTARAAINQVRSAITGSADGFDGAFSSLAEIGVTTQEDGTLSINTERLNAAFADNFEDVAGVFARLGRLDDSNIDVQLLGERTDVGSLSVEVTQLATQGNLLGAAITAPSGAAPLVIDDQNDALTLLIDGIETEVALTQGSFQSGDDLAAELQARINGTAAISSAGARVSVSFTDANQLQITSERFGSNSRVEITAVDTATAASLGLNVAAGTAGQDVAGRIGGISATGDGQVLTGAEGGIAAGVALTVTGGALGNRGVLNVSQGIAESLDTVLDGLLGGDGILGSRTDGLQTSIDRLGDERAALDLRLQALEARYRQQFNALDTLLSNISSTSDFLTRQLATIPVPGSDNTNS
ncbi:MAG: flagellar filament capping protein FliD [Pseudomonadota bacterium]